MKYSEEELKKLNKLLEDQLDIIKDKRIIKALGSFNKFYSSFHTFFSTLCSEKIITQDPYGDEYNLKSLNPPDSSEVPYNEEGYTISIRLTHYNSILTYIKVKNIISLENLNPTVINKIINLVHFLDWNRLFDPQPIETNTEALNKVLFYYKKDRGQQYILSSIKSSLTDIERYGKDLIKMLEPISLYIREKYKLWIRENVLTNLKLPPELQGKDIKKAHDMIRMKIHELGQPIYIELIGEVLQEDFTENGLNVRKEILTKLEEIDVESKDNTKKKKSITNEKPIDILEKSLHELMNISTQTNSIIEKMWVNSIGLREETYSFIEKIIDYLKYTLLGSPRNTTYLVKTVEGEQKEKSLEFEKFISKTKILNKQLSDLKENIDDCYSSLIAEGEDEVSKKLHKLLSKSRFTYKNLLMLDNFFKNNLKDSKGIQIELKVFLSSIDKSQASYFEYKKIIDDLEKTTYKPDINLTT
ncbi:hypothetical protein EW093_08975 [Thiospirochaeta perfilievii]|uniref:Uncharacterized protein n=1 Tax=Thiospirochaeta perfilievii TaxID=252967 RepID=A0A5C1QCY7_9SPIO|nr:hypothetical protein [Thiospirochaeta perfilievii]QEN04829.1 hypothetical protein EW093_08975 [Thiospirochaeta perfilievii]